MNISRETTDGSRMVLLTAKPPGRQWDINMYIIILIINLGSIVCPPWWLSRHRLDGLFLQLAKVKLRRISRCCWNVCEEVDLGENWTSSPTEELDRPVNCSVRPMSDCSRQWPPTVSVAGGHHHQCWPLSRCSVGLHPMWRAGAGRSRCPCGQCLARRIDVRTPRRHYWTTSGSSWSSWSGAGVERMNSLMPDYLK